MTKERIDEIIRLLEEEYPLADCTLDFRKDYELLFSVRLAAQCTENAVYGNNYIWCCNITYLT